MITKSLMEFVSVLCPSNQDAYFWADQISMNQKDVNERNHQVGLMSKIYRNAKTVYACLGEAYQNIRVIRHFSLLWEQGAEPHRSLRDYPNVIRSLLDIFARPYWSRLWILQELCLAGSVIFWIGRETFKLEFLADCWNAPALEDRRLTSIPYGSIRVSEETWDSFTEHQDAVHLIMTRHSFHKQPDLLPALYMSRHNLCSDSRDRIYGVQALIRETQRVPVDYSSSFRQLSIIVLQRITASLIRRFERHSRWYELDNAMQKCIELQLGLDDTKTECRKIVETMFWSVRVSCACSYATKSISERGSKLWLWADIHNKALTARHKLFAIDLGELVHLHVEPWRDLERPAWLGKRNVPRELWEQRQREAEEVNVELIIESVMFKHGFVWYGDIIAHPDEWLLKEGSSPVIPSGHNVEYFYQDLSTPADSAESTVAGALATLEGRDQSHGQVSSNHKGTSAPLGMRTRLLRCLRTSGARLTGLKS